VSVDFTAVFNMSCFFGLGGGLTLLALFFAGSYDVNQVVIDFAIGLNLAGISQHQIVPQVAFARIQH